MTPTATEPLSLPAGQALLFSPEIEECVAAAENREGRYTGERFKVRRPAAYQGAIELLGAGVGLEKIGRFLGVHHLTIAAVRDRELEAIDMASQTLGKLDTLLQLQLDQMLEHPSLVPHTHKGMLLDQVVRIRELLSGRATARVEHTGPIDVHGDWESILQTFVSEKELTADQVREIDPSIGFEPGKNLPIGEGGEEAGEEADPDPDPDVESDVRTIEPEPNLATNIATLAPAKVNSSLAAAADPAGAQPGSRAAAGAGEGGGGGRPARAARPDQTQSSGDKILDNAFPPPL